MSADVAQIPTSFLFCSANCWVVSRTIVLGLARLFKPLITIIAKDLESKTYFGSRMRNDEVKRNSMNAIVTLFPVFLFQANAID